MRTALLLLATFTTVGLAQTTVFSWSGTTPSEHLGASLAGPGDLNGDGVPDIVIGGTATEYLQTATDGSVTARSGADGTVLWHIDGMTNESLGIAVAKAGDVNGDGIPDLVVGAPGGRGIVILSGVDGSVIRTMPDPCVRVDGGFDFNGDGVPDQLGCWAAPVLLGAGGVKVYSGMNGAVLLNITTSQPYVYPGNGGNDFRASFIKDSDNDGFDDVIASRTISGIVIRFRGPNGAGGGVVTVSNPNTIIGGVHDAGNLTGDTKEDATAATWDFSSGLNVFHFRLYNGGSGAVAWDIVSVPANPGLNIYGWEVARMPDLDGDGIPDLVSPSWVSGASGVSTATGATALSGATGAVLFSVFTPTPMSGLGTIATIGDITGDGVPEFAFGYAEYPTGGGIVEVVSPVTLPSGSVFNLGGGCGAFSTVLAASTPIIGATLSLSVSGGQPSSSASIFVDPAADVATPIGACVIHLDFAHANQWIQFPVTLDIAGAASFSYPVPTIPALGGHPFTTQAVVFGTPSPLGIDLSNGLRGIVGY